MKRARWKLHGYCLMSNHVHLLIQTPEPTLPLGMQFLMSQYVRSSTFDTGGEARSSRAGTRRGLVETSEHYLSCLQYFALNPVTAGLCDRPEDWPWSSYRGSALLRRELDMSFA